MHSRFLFFPNYKSLLCLILLLNTFIAAWAVNDTTLLTEDFSSNVNRWPVFSNSTASAKLENGVYSFSYNGDASYDFITNSISLEASTKDFILCAEFKLIRGKDSSAYGMNWGRKDSKNGYYFLITPAGNYSIFFLDNGEIKKICPYKHSNLIQPTDKINQLSIRKKNDLMYFNINGVQVFKSKYFFFYGEQLGFDMNGAASVVVTKITAKIFPLREYVVDYKPSVINMPPDTLLYDLFKDNKNDWQVYDNDNSSAKVNMGTYLITRKSSSGTSNFMKYLFMNASTDYYIESAMTQQTGVTNNGFGLLWGAQDGSNIYFFNIASDGYFCAYGYNNGIYIYLIPWRKLNNIKPLGKENKLAVQRKGSHLYFYVNDVRAGECEDNQIKGPYLGFSVNMNMSVAARYILVKGQGSPINLIKKSSQGGARKENLGENINSPYAEVAPVITADGKYLYFDRTDHPDNIGAKEKPNDDVWVSTQDSTGQWTKAVNINSPINNNGYNSVISVSPDNNTLYLTNTYNSDGSFIPFGISVSRRTMNGWSIPTAEEVKNFYKNSNKVGYCFSADGKVLFLALERDDSYGGQDLYVCFSTGEGKWSEPKNIGSTVNTFSDDFAPYMAADNLTLYYTTYGKPGFGSADIYVTRRLDDSWTNWSEPENLGPEINSKNWDAYFTINANGDYAYLASNDNSIGETDIFRIKLDESAKPKPVILLSGKVLNSKTKEPIGTEITCQDLTTNSEVGVAASSPQDGSFKIVLTAGKKYSFYATKEGFYPISENFDATTISQYKEVEKNLFIAPIEKGMAIRLNNLFFDYNKSELLQTSFGELDRLIKILADDKEMKIEVGGYTDSKGDEKYNINLSKARAQSVADYLISKGITVDRLIIKGYGKSMPVAKNDTEEGRAQNRRVEFKILNK